MVFDLDDTLILERDFVRSGFRAVACHLGCAAGASGEASFDWLWGQFEAGVRGDTFDRLQCAFPALQGRVTTEELVRIYREHVPELTLLPGAEALLTGLAERGVRLGLLSDGPLICQRNKLCALGLQERFTPALFSDGWGREFWKPHVRGYQEFATQWRLAADRLFYIGDNPAKDFVTPNRLGWHTIRLRMPGQVRETLEPPTSDHAPHHEVFDLPSLERLLKKMSLEALS